LKATQEVPVAAPSQSRFPRSPPPPPHQGSVRFTASLAKVSPSLHFLSFQFPRPHLGLHRPPSLSFLFSRWLDSSPIDVSPEASFLFSVPCFSSPCGGFSFFPLRFSAHRFCLLFGPSFFWRNSPPFSLQMERPFPSLGRGRGLLL